jgi:hypothetical protein
MSLEAQLPMSSYGWVGLGVFVKLSALMDPAPSSNPASSSSAADPGKYHARRKRQTQHPVFSGNSCIGGSIGYNIRVSAISREMQAFSCRCCAVFALCYFMPLWRSLFAPHFAPLLAICYIFFEHELILSCSPPKQSEVQF